MIPGFARVTVLLALALLVGCGQPDAPRADRRALDASAAGAPGVDMASSASVAAAATSAATRSFRDCASCPEMVVLPAGHFRMGGRDAVGEPYADEKPVHPVEIASLAIGKYPVTQAQWQALMGTNPSEFRGPHRPVDHISWHDARKYVRRLRARTGKNYRLPTEAQWEYAARAGTTTAYDFGNDAGRLADYGWVGESTAHETHPVGRLKPDRWGLHDMYGNVWTWVDDCYHSNYQGAPHDGSAWVRDCEGPDRVLRGGSVYDSARNARAANRAHLPPHSRQNDVGLRVVRLPDAG